MPQRPNAPSTPWRRCIERDSPSLVDSHVGAVGPEVHVSGERLIAGLRLLGWSAVSFIPVAAVLAGLNLAIALAIIRERGRLLAAAPAVGAVEGVATP